MMNRHLPSLVIVNVVLCAFAACSDPPQSNAQTDNDVAEDDGLRFGDSVLPDAGTSDVIDPALRSNRQRSCATRFVYKTTDAAKKVQVAGDWGWDKPEDMQLGAGEFTLDKELSTGLHCYKFIVDGKWILDPSHAYRAWCDDVENSGVRVPDCKDPTWTINGDVTRTSSGLKAEVLLWRGADNAAPKSVEVMIRSNFEDTPVEDAWRPDNESVVLDLTELSHGKYTVVLVATMANGRKTEPLLLPFWVEDEAFTWQDAVIYLAMVDRFADGDPKNNAKDDKSVAEGARWLGGDLAGLKKQIESGWLDKLGVRALWLTPIATVTDKTHEGGDKAKIVSGYHGYWPTQARGVDPRFGTAAELEALVKAAHGRGIRVLMDLVLNHVHSDHEYYINKPAWFRDGCVCGTKDCDWTEKALSCVFAPYMPDTNWTSNEASEALLDDALWWLERFDLDGARVDAVKHIETSATFNLVSRVRQRFETAGTDYFLTGETAMGWSGDKLEDNAQQYGTINKYMGPSGVDGQFDFVLYHAVVDRVLAGDEKGMVHLDVWTGHSQTQYAAGAVMTPYIGSHDTARFLSRADYRGQKDHSKDVVLNKWTDQSLPEKPDEKDAYDRARLAHCWLLTIPGAPLLYMGDAYGEFGGRDPDNRHMWRGDKPLDDNESALLEAVRKLGTARQQLPALRRGNYTSLGATETLMPFMRGSKGDNAVVVVLNKSDTEATFTVDPTATGITAESAKEVLGLGGKVVKGATGVQVTVPAFSCAAVM